MIVNTPLRQAAALFASSLVILLLIGSGLQAQEDDDFTIVIFGDTQRQVEYRNKDAPDPNTLDPNDPNNFKRPDAYEAFKKTVDWLVDEDNPEPIALILHVGDVIQHGSKDLSSTNTTVFEWRVFDEQWQKLESKFPALVARGNHDNTAEFAELYGDPNSPSPGDASAVEVTLAGEEVVVIFGLPCNPTAGQIDWAEGLLDDDPNRPAILVSHIITDPNGGHQESPPSSVPYILEVDACLGNTAPNLWDDLVEPYSDQIFLAASGHFTRVCTDIQQNQCRKWDESVGMGFKKLREVTKSSVDYHVLDTMQNWQRVHSNDPNASAAVPGSGKGFVTLVRFLNQRGADPSVEVLAVDPSQIDANNPDPVEDERDGITSLSRKWFNFALNKVDGDGDDNADDNCPYAYNPDQEDTGGIAEDPPDGIGDACQCGDVTGDGKVNSADATMIIREALGLSAPGFNVPGNCDVTGDENCNSADATMVTRKALGLWAPVFGNNCENFVGQAAYPTSAFADLDTDIDPNGDPDPDGVLNYDDNCIIDYNPGQEDEDEDGIGDACEQCGNGIDDDGDGFVDANDPGCDDADDTWEGNTAYECDDGIDNDGDGLVDSADDPGCGGLPNWTGGESPECSNGIDDDADGDVDYPADTLCVDAADLSESSGPCGIGFELVFILPPLIWMYQRQKRNRSSSARGNSHWAALGLAFLWTIGGSAISSAEEATFYLNSTSFIQESSERGGAVYEFPANARVQLVFGEARNGVVPITVPLDGVELGAAQARVGNRTPISFGLVEPAKGSLRIDSRGKGTVVIHAAVLVENASRTRVTRFDLRLTTEAVLGHPGQPNVQGQALETGSGTMTLVSPGQIQGDGYTLPVGFRVVLSGELDQVPASISALAGG
jgi:hypothetical protein